MASQSNIYGFIKDEVGAVATYVALLAPFLVGLMALGIEVNGWRMVQSKLQQVADVTAFSGAISLGANGTDTAVNATIFDVGVSSGVTMSELTGSGILRSGADIPATCSTSAPNCVKVTVSRTLDRFFSSYFSDSSTIEITASAIAAITSGETLANCIYATTLIDLSGNSVLNIPDCYGYARNTILTGNSSVTNGCLFDSNASEYGECTTNYVEPNTDETNALQESWIPSVSDYSIEAVCPDSGEISPSATVVKDGHTIPYCVFPVEGLSGDIQLAPGLYIIPSLPKSNGRGFDVYHFNQNITMAGAPSSFGYDGITFLLEPDAELELNGNTTFGAIDVPLTAPTDLTNPLFSRIIVGANTSRLVLKGTSDLNMEGIIHLAGSSSLEITGTSDLDDQSNCLAIAVDTLEVGGNGLISLDGACVIEKFGSSYISTTDIAGGARIVN
jgi:Flp pilus assembly protein TadG